MTRRHLYNAILTFIHVSVLYQEPQLVPHQVATVVASDLVMLVLSFIFEHHQSKSCWSIGRPTVKINWLVPSHSQPLLVTFTSFKLLNYNY